MRQYRLVGAAAASRPKGVKTRWPPEVAAEPAAWPTGSSSYTNTVAMSIRRCSRSCVALWRSSGALGLREKIEAPRASRRQPLGA